ncbi:hypothetical protein HDF16_000658 [Granulicella aggregans]|uniref:HEAT repeat protein n=1 Tax=Granulicella aggregans TaxID=474949 RepID=A0A7W7Z9T5_9BACT|nr:HEAT repeat domain-containing protein [Granulicella aggregans]MBB5055989.1 hypothetical protein [Granulicella aggregans]
MRSVLGLAVLAVGMTAQNASATLVSPGAGSAMVMLLDDGAYGDGTKAMNEQRWQDAVSSFDKVIQSKDRKSDAALYWKAYSLKKLGNAQAAASTCDELRARFTASSWNRDCSALTVDARVSIPPVEMERHEHSTGRTPDEDLKILAMNSLLNQNPEKAVPILRGMLGSNQPPSLRKHALFVLAQSKSPEAEAILHDAELGKMGPDVQHDAIQAAGVFLGKKNNGTLVEVYKSTGDAKIKRSVVSALSVSQDASRMVDLARSEKDIEMKRSIVSQLAIMHDKVAEDYMLELLK